MPSQCHPELHTSFSLIMQAPCLCLFCLCLCLCLHTVPVHVSPPDPIAVRDEKPWLCRPACSCASCGTSSYSCEGE